MSAAKTTHTPWTFEINGGAFDVFDSRGNLVCAYASVDMARLIVSLPALLEALKLAESLLEDVRDVVSSGTSRVDDTLVVVRAAIAKAQP